jgi:ABC-type bacteriocin/lantibiotic exporter with double-glycine peptidase domain
MTNNVSQSAIKKNIGWLLAMLMSFSVFGTAEIFLVTRIGELFDLASDSTLSIIEVLREQTILFLIPLGTVLGFLLLYTYLQAEFLKRVQLYTRTQYFNHLLQLSLADFSKKDVTYYESVLVNDIKKLQALYYIPLLSILQQSLSLLISIAFLARYNLIIVAFVLVFSTLPVFIPKLFKQRLQVLTAKHENTMEEYTRLTRALLDGYKDFYSYGAIKYALSAHKKSNNTYAKAEKGSCSFSDWIANAAIFSGYLVSIGTLILATTFSIYGTLTIGDIFAIFFVAAGVSAPINELLENTPRLLSGIIFLNKFDSLIPTKSDVPALTFEDSISLNNLVIVSETENKVIIKNVTMDFLPSKKYLVVGESGSGKTTIVKAMMGCFDITQGEIRYDGIILDKASRLSVFDHITYVQKHAIFFSDTIWNNLSMYQANITQMNLIKMLNFVGLSEKITSLGNGNITNGLTVTMTVNADGFSEGEKQRLALARALLKNAKCLILDEAISAIDIKSATQIEKNLLANQALTIISIEHRLLEDNLSLYDKVLIIEDGEMHEKDTY